MPTLYVTVGLPRSGKTTEARKRPYPIVCPDAIRLALHGEAFISKAEPWVWVIAKTMVRALFEAGHDAVVLDATNTTRKRRDEWQDPAWETRFLVINTPAHVCHTRAEEAGRPELHAVIDRMTAAFEPLGADERLG